MDNATAGDVLAQPTRAKLFALLEEARQPLSSEALATKLGLHVNGVRRHLERLEEAGLLERSKAQGGRGRPADRWTIGSSAGPGGPAPRAYADLSGWLARALDRGPARLGQVERTGREIGRELAPADVDRSGESFRAVVAALGFQPELEVDEDGTARCRLCNCPYRDSVKESPDVVCTLHRGITAGLLDELAPEGSLASFVPHDPDEAGCEIVVEGVDWPPLRTGPS
ncbi:MAG TPA: helix-turn-helix domain-containing protein [Solirubrobacterales bacterium]